MRKQFLLLALSLGIFCFIQSCKKDIEDFNNVEEVELNNWSPTYIVNVIDTSFHINEYLEELNEEGNIEVDQDGLIKIVYSDEMFSTEGEEVVDIPDFKIPLIINNISYPSNILPIGYEMTKAKFKAGKLNIELINTYQTDLNVELVIENLQENNEVFVQNIPVQWNGETSQIIRKEIDLNGKVLNLSDGNIDIRYSAERVDNQQAVIFHDFTLDFVEMSYAFVQGKFGALDFELPSDKIDFDIYSEEDLEGGSLFLEDPIIRVHFNNSYGVPVKLFSEMIAFETHNGGTMQLQSDLDAGFEFNYPSMNEFGESKSSTLELNSQNSNVREILANNPYSLEYNLYAQTISDYTEGFVMDHSQFEVDMDVEIPLWFKLQTLNLETTADFSIEDVDFIQEATFILNMDNGLPIEADLQIYFEDDNGNVLAKLLDEDQLVLSSGVLNDDGRVIEASSQRTEIEVPEEKLIALQNATKVRFVPSISTTDNGNVSVKIYDDYSVNISLTAKITVEAP